MNITLEIEKLDECPLCGCNELRDLIVTRDFQSGLGEFPIQDCPSCGLAFTNPRPTEKSIPLLYSGRDTPDFAAGIRSFTQRLRGLSIRSYLRHRIPSAAGGQLDVLDFGCGDGSLSFHATMGPTRPIVTSVDFHDHSPPLLSETGGRATYKSYWDWRGNHERYDVIFLRHVLEHHPEPTRLLAELVQSLKPGGAVHIEVPNRRSIWAKIFGPNYFAYYVPRHLMHFDADSLARAINESGLKLEEIRKGHTPQIGGSLGNVLSKDIDNLSVLGVLLYPLQVLLDTAFGLSTTLRASARR